MTGPPELTITRGSYPAKTRAYCRGFWAALLGRDCLPTYYHRQDWIEGYDDGTWEKCRHEDAVRLALRGAD